MGAQARRLHAGKMPAFPMKFMEVAGIEPASEKAPTGASTGVVCVLFIRVNHLPQTGYDIPYSSMFPLKSEDGYFQVSCHFDARVHTLQARFGRT